VLSRCLLGFISTASIVQSGVLLEHTLLSHSDELTTIGHANFNAYEGMNGPTN
jgi:hypothetical protein